MRGHHSVLLLLGLLAVFATACSSSAGTGGSGLAVGGGDGWTVVDGFVGGFGDGTSVASDVGGGNTAAADAAGDTAADTTCSPNCAGLLCGDDGCGGSCGTCAAEQACVQGGVCKQLAPKDLCKGFSCDANAYCTDVDGKATCTCKLRYEGNGKSCKDLDECKTNNGGCDENAFCTNNVGAAPACVCMSGFDGNGVKCIDVDECKAGTAKCGAHAVCVNTSGSWECSCDAGFSKASAGCVDIDECATANPPCDANATCANTDGAYACTCKAGYKGNGFTCNQDKDCNGTCDSNAACVPQAGKASECVCGAGYSGSGTACYAVPSTVALVGVVLSPFDPDDNKTWDGGAIPESDRLQFEKMVADAAKAYATGNWLALLPSVANLAGFLSNMTSPPDPFGSVSLSSQGKVVGGFQLPKVSNTLGPSWPGVSWSGVTVDASTKMTIDLYDSDAMFDDLIGKASLSGKDLVNALKFGKPLPVDVHKQGKGGIVFIQVQVTPAYVCGNGQCDAAAGEKSWNCPKDCGGGTSSGGGHFCDANCGNGNAAKTCYCDETCKQYGDCCDATGTGKAGNSCAGSTCGLCK